MVTDKVETRLDFEISLGPVQCQPASRPCSPSSRHAAGRPGAAVPPWPARAARAGTLRRRGARIDERLPKVLVSVFVHVTCWMSADSANNPKPGGRATEARYFVVLGARFQEADRVACFSTPSQSALTPVKVHKVESPGLMPVSHVKPQTAGCPEVSTSGAQLRC